MARVLSIDIAIRNTGYSVLDNSSVIHTERFVTKAENFYHPEYLEEHIMKLTDMLQVYKPDAVAVEGSALQAQNWQFAIGALFGVVSHKLYKEGFPTLVVPPMKWKKFICDKGNASKAEIKSAILNKFQLKANLSQDEYDATGIGYFAMVALLAFVKKDLSLKKPIRDLFLHPESGILNSSKLSFNLENLGELKFK